MENKNQVTTKKTGAELIVNNSFIDGLAMQLEEKKKYGLTFPADYNPTNALTGAYLMLKETNDKNGKCVLETCTQVSIANTLMDMVTMGLSMQKKQCYPIAYGGKLSCQVSYHGNKVMAHRYGAKAINSEVIYDGDTFKYHLENGVKILDEHTQDFLNIDLTKIKGAYCIVIFEDGSTCMEVMNINQIKTAWKKGYGYKENAGTHAEFTDMMAKKTVTSRACKQIVQQYGDIFAVESFEKAEELEGVDIVSEDVHYDIKQNANSEDFDEECVRDVEIIETEVVIEDKPKQATKTESKEDLPDFLQ